MNGPEFKAWRDAFGLSQAEIADKIGVTRTTIQNWEGTPGVLPPTVDACIQVWDRRLRQEDPARGPITLIYTDGPMWIDPYGPRRPMAMMKQEVHQSNAAVLARVQMLAGRPGVVNPFVMEDGGHDIWNVNELQRVIDGEDDGAPTLTNLLCHLAAGIRADAPNFVRSGPRMASQEAVDFHVSGFGTFAEELERIAGKTVSEILEEQQTVEAIFAGVRQLGVQPRDALVNAVAQALVAARMPVEKI